MSRYHVLPRDSIESEEREAREFLIPSPVSNVINMSGLPSPRSCSIGFRPSIMLRVMSSVFALVGLLVVTINQEPLGALVAMAVFFGLIIATNCIRLVSLPFTGQSSLRVAIYYNDRDLLARPHDRSARPSFFTFLDIAWCIGLLIATTLWRGQYNYWSVPDGPIAGSVFAGFVIAIQLFIAVPFIDRVGLTIKSSVRPTNQRIFLDADIVQPVAVKDRKEPVMTGAIETEPEQTAIPPPSSPPQASRGDASNLV